jgi:hypothetical protein
MAASARPVQVLRRLAGGYLDLEAIETSPPKETESHHMVIDQRARPNGFGKNNSPAPRHQPPLAGILRRSVIASQAPDGSTSGISKW